MKRYFHHWHKNLGTVSQIRGYKIDLWNTQTAQVLRELLALRLRRIESLGDRTRGHVEKLKSSLILPRRLGKSAWSGRTCQTLFGLSLRW